MLRRRLSGRFLFPLLVVAASFAAHGISLRNGFVYDDTDLIVHRGRAEEESGLSGLELRERPVRRITLMIDHALWGQRPAGYHLTNVSLHAMCALLVLLIGLRISTRNAALAAALLFAVHPVATESVACITHRKEMLAAGFLMGGFLLFFRRPERTGNYLSAAVLYTAGLFSKASAGTLPLLLGATEWIRGEWRYRRAVKYVPLLVPALFFLAVKYTALQNYNSARKGGRSYYQRFNPELHGDPSYGSVLVNAAVAQGLAFRYFLWPNPLSAEHTLPRGRGAIVAWALSAAAGVALLLWLVIRFRRRRPGVAIAAAWMLITPLPTANLVPVTYFFAERYLYIPLAGFCWIAGVAAVELAALPASKQTRLAVSLALLVPFCAAAFLTASRTTCWKDNDTLLTRTLETNRDAPNAGYYRASLLAERGKRDEAIRILRSVMKRCPESPVIHAKLGSIFWDAGDFDSSLVHLERAALLRPRWGKVLGDIGTLYCRKGDFRTGVEKLREALALKPDLSPDLSSARYNLGVAYLKTGKPEVAREQLRIASAAEGDDTSIALAFAEASLLSKHPEEAAIVLEEVLRRSPGNAAALWGVARARLALGDTVACCANLDAVLAAARKGEPLAEEAEKLLASLRGATARKGDR